MADNRIDILGYRVSDLGLTLAVDLAWRFARSARDSRYVACANPHSLVVAARDGVFRSALQEADLLLPDGVGVLLAAKALHLPLQQRVCGYEFFIGLARRAAQSGHVRFFFLGAQQDTLRRIEQRLAREFPTITVCGCYAPPYRSRFSAHENACMVEAVRRARPDILFVGMTAPKQEKWIHKNRDRLQVPLIAAVGAVFDFYAGTRRRAPDWICALGLEWLFRLVRDPRRMFIRNFVSTPCFLWMVLREWWRLHAIRRCTQ